jgi:hypothetical protein
MLKNTYRFCCFIKYILRLDKYVYLFIYFLDDHSMVAESSVVLALICTFKTFHRFLKWFKRKEIKILQSL